MIHVNTFGADCTCKLQATSKGIFKPVHKISLSHCISHIIRAHLGVYFCLLLLIFCLGPSTYHRTSLLQNSKAASLFFRAHTFLILTGKMPDSQSLPFQNPTSQFNEFYISFHRVCRLAALVLIIIVLGAWNRSTIPKHRVSPPPQHSLKSFPWHSAISIYYNITTIFSASSATSSRAGSFRRRQRSWKPIDQKQKLLFFIFKIPPLRQIHSVLRI